MRAFTSEELRLDLNIHGRRVDMLNRCRLSSNKNYRNYGERGIRVCDEWQGGKDVFFKFFEYVSNLPYFGEEGHTLDRIDVNYAPGNVRWATVKTQVRNRRKTIFVTDLDGNEISLNAATSLYSLRLSQNANISQHLRVPIKSTRPTSARAKPLSRSAGALLSLNVPKRKFLTARTM